MEGQFLNLGAGSHKLDGFINVDLDPSADVRHDLSEPLPWADNSVDGIFSEHFIEHLTQANGLHLLRECHRVLKPGGRCRIATPDLDEIVDDYVQNRIQPDWVRFGLDWVANRCERLNIGMRWWGHSYLYNEEELVRIGCMVGLQFVGRFEYGESEAPRFQKLEHRAASRLIVEFIKPERQLSEDANPLVSIAMPTFNPRFFATALDSALAQTYTNIEIVITDDCPSNAIEEIARKRMAQDKRIRYHKNATRLVRLNTVECFNRSSGEFVKFLNDDDVLAPNCVSRMVDAYKAAPDVTLVTSHRQLIDATGESLPDIVATKRIYPQDMLVDGLSLMQVLLNCQVNFIGEPSTVMFRKAELEHLRPDFMSIDNIQVRNITDVTMWFHLAFRGNVVFLSESLSSFRRHAEQRQHDPSIPSAQWAAEGWKRLLSWWERKELARRREQGFLFWKPMDDLSESWRKLNLTREILFQGQMQASKAQMPKPPVDWNEPAYLAANPDVALAIKQRRFESGYDHFVKFGRNENRPIGVPVKAPHGISDTESHQLRYQSAEALLAAGKEEEGAAILISLVNEQTTLWMPYNDLGILAFRQGDSRTALEFLAAAVERESQPGPARLNLATVAAGAGKYDAAMGALDPLLRATPPDTAAVELAGEIRAASARGTLA